MGQYYLRIAFRIELHKDDVEVLHKIKAYLGVGNVNTYDTRAYFCLYNVKDIVTVLLPLLDKHTLRTVKFLDYTDFKAMALLLSQGSSRVQGEDLALAIKTSSGMNQKRKKYDYSILKKCGF